MQDPRLRIHSIEQIAEPSQEGNMLRNLVIGAEGFVGKPLCAYLESIGETVQRFDITRHKEKEDARIVSLDLEKIDRVYFLAWEVGGAKYLYRDDIQFVQLDWNLKLLLNVMPQLQGNRVPFLFVSSQLAEETDTVYGVTKRLGEVWTRLLNQTRVRLWNVYGAYEQVSSRSHVVVDFVHQAITQGEIKMLTTGEERRQFIYIDDVCEGFHAAIDRHEKELRDITSFEWVTVKRVAEIIGSIAGARVIPGTVKGSTPVTPIMGKLENWQPRVSLEEGLDRLVRKTREMLS